MSIPKPCPALSIFRQPVEGSGVPATLLVTGADGGAATGATAFEQPPLTENESMKVRPARREVSPSLSPTKSRT
jgi:hypothetical protein